MTIILTSPHGKSKAVLQQALNSTPDQVTFDDPSIVAPRAFLGSHIRLGEKFAVVMDHPKRMRFAQVARTAKGYKVT